jgi:hypothetical protein
MELSPAGRWADLPEDIALAVASRLQVGALSLSLAPWNILQGSLADSAGSNRAQEADVCALGGCSRSWRSACDADCIWERLFRCRWPAAAAEASASSSRVQVRKEG